MIYSFYDRKLLMKALEVAKKAHLGQTYTENEDYFEAHIMKVVNVLAKHNESYLAQIIGALHDIYEDTGISREEIRNEFGEDVDTAIWILTRQPTETYFDYIRRIKQDEICRRIKLEDATCNYKTSVISGNESLQGRYSRAMLILLGYD